MHTSQETLDGHQDGAHIVQRGPLVLQDVQADEALRVHVGVKAGGDEPHCGGVEGVAAGEFQRELEPQAFVHLEEKEKFKESYLLNTLEQNSPTFHSKPYKN